MEVRDCRDLPVDSQWTLINHRHSQALIRWSRSLVYYHLVNSNQIAIGNENTSAFVIDVRMNLAMIRYKSSSSSSVSDDLKPSDYHQNVMSVRLNKMRNQLAALGFKL